MKACQSEIDRALKVRYLDEKGADFQAKDRVRQNCNLLHICYEIVMSFFRLGGRLCFMPPAIHGVEMMWKMFFDTLLMKKELMSILLVRWHSYNFNGHFRFQNYFRRE